MAITTNGGAGVTADAVATLTNKTLTAPTISDATFTGQQSGLQISFNQSIVFEGTTADASETTLSAGEPTADRVITLPDATDTLVGKATTDTLTNKTISGASNTLTVRLDNTDVTGTLVATKGGTAQSTYTTGDILYASASNTLSKLAVGTTGQVLTIAGGVPTYATPSAGTTANDQAFAFAVQVFA